MVVTHSGIEVNDAARLLPKLGRDACALNANLAHGIGAKPHREIAAHRRGDLEAVEHINGLVSICTSNVDLTRRILHHLRQEWQRIADVA